MNPNIGLDNIIILSLLTWRITVLITYDQWIFDLGIKFRAKIGVYYGEHSERLARNWFAKMLNCHFCTSLWVGWFIALVWLREPEFIVMGLVLSAGSLIMNKLIPTL